MILPTLLESSRQRLRAVADASLDRTIQVGTAIAIASVGIDSLHKFLPSVAEVRKAGPGDAEMAANVHAGELLAGITVVTVSMLASSVAGNGLPLVIGCTGFLAMAGTYEWLLRAHRPFQENDQ